MLSDAELDRIEGEMLAQLRENPDGASLGYYQADCESLLAEVRRLRGIRATDAELEAIRKRYELRVLSYAPAKPPPSAQDCGCLLAHIAFQSTVIADLRTDLANENQFAAGFRAAREMAKAAISKGNHYWLDNLNAIAALTPEQYAARTRKETP